MKEDHNRISSLCKFEPKTNSFPDEFLRWRDVEPGMMIVSRFDITHWQDIMPFASSDEEVYTFLRDTRNYARMYVLEDVLSQKILGVCLLIVANSRKRTVNLHGGIFTKNYSPLKCCNGLLIMIDALMNYGWHVRSHSKTLRAYRLLKSLGFRICGYYNGFIYSYINKKLLHNSPIYRRISYQINNTPTVH